MRRFIAVITAALLVGALVTSCSKSLENRMSGKWQLESATKRVTGGSFPFQTGYENGYFNLNDNGLATYIENTDTLTGFWKVGKHNKGIYNNSSNTWQSKDMRFLLINVSNPLLHTSLELRFDDIDFLHNGKTLIAEQYVLGYDRIYTFKKR